MKKKKFELIVVIAMMLTLIINTTCVSANDKTNDDYSIPQKIIDIANGSDEIYGEGVPIEHIDPNKRSQSLQVEVLIIPISTLWLQH